MGYDKFEDTFLMDVSTHWLQEENNLECLDIEVGRKIVDFYNTKYGGLCDSERIPLWAVCKDSSSAKIVLLATLSYKDHFDRAIINHLEPIDVPDLSIEDLKAKHLQIYGSFSALHHFYDVEAVYRISGRRTKTAESINKNHNGMTQLGCKWTSLTLQIPAHETSVNLHQEVVVGHEINLCSAMLWKSVCAIQGISNAVINLSSIANANSISNISIRPYNPLWKGPSQVKLEDDLKELLNDVEAYSGLPCGPKGGCIFITDDCTSIDAALIKLLYGGSSYDFTYKLWDILRDCDTVEDLISLLVSALKSIYKRNLRPYIDPGNTTFLGSLVKKLARGLSQQAVKSISTLYNNPIKALNIIGQLGIAKTSWEYTNIFATVDSTLAFNDKLKLSNKMPEINEDAVNQTMLEMTLGSGDVTVNPFDTKFNLTDSTFIQDADSSAQCDDMADLTLDNFASFKKHNIEVKTDRQSWKDQPLFSDEVNIELSSKEWKFKTTRLAQLHVCLEHMHRSQMSLKLDFNSMKPITTQLLQFYLSEKSPIKTVDQLHNEPVQIFTMPIKYKTVREHLEFKHPSLYRISFKSETYANNATQVGSEPIQTTVSTYVCSQQSVFPPCISAPKDTEFQEENATLQYYFSHYIFLSNKMCDPNIEKST
ncbi:uncharacterized protein LOC143912320 [Arctopsyche grandis]|uniref:uncharacterized protein LOC143912320 n=1 Tax=Arctopsyche grandis TaxID=121162 RepID=UPI00406D7F21